MNNDRRRCSLAIALLLVVFLVPQTALALSPKSVSKFKGTTTIYEETAYSFSSGNVYDLTSSNRRVVKVSMSYDYYDIWTNRTKKVVLLTPGKPGKATVSFMIGSKKYKMKVKVKKRAVAATSVKATMFTYKKGGKRVDIGAGSTVKPNDVLSGKKWGVWCWTKGYSRAVKVKAAKGWKLKRIDFYNDGKIKRLKNGGKVPKGEFGDYNFFGEIYITMQNKKNKGIETIALGGTS